MQQMQMQAQQTNHEHAASTKRTNRPREMIEVMAIQERKIDAANLSIKKKGILKQKFLDYNKIRNSDVENETRLAWKWMPNKPGLRWMRQLISTTSQ